jgi:cyclopropane-fatty-acyl-phospholipid synthase
MPLIGPTVSIKRPAQIMARPAPIRRLLERALPALSAGRLHITLPNSQTIERRGTGDGLDAALTVHRWRGVRRILLGGEDGFADAYIDGDWSTPDLPRLLELCMQNEEQLTSTAPSSLLGLTRKRLLHLFRSNTQRGSRRNIAAHYDLGNDFFGAWLDAGMNYSSALFTGNDTLEQAQGRKLDRIVELLALSDDKSVLEIGCGWGALAERLVRAHGASVLGTTLSGEQLAYAKARLADTAHADLRRLDYRDVTGTFDRIASVEMIEAVGERYWPVYFGKLRSCLMRGGSAVIQAITIDETRFAEYRKRPDFIQRHIFPGGMLPTCAIIVRQAERAGLNLAHHESFGHSYVATLQEWRSRFLRAWPKLEQLGFDQRFRRMWDYYLAYCEVGFKLRMVDVGLYKFTG